MATILGSRNADRLSANIELPRDEAMSRFAPQKDVGVIKQAMAKQCMNTLSTFRARTRPP